MFMIIKLHRPQLIVCARIVRIILVGAAGQLRPRLLAKVGRYPRALAHGSTFLDRGIRGRLAARRAAVAALVRLSRAR